MTRKRVQGRDGGRIALDSARIDLAHEADFTIGGLTVHPSTREVSRGDARQVIEPRIMQVLVALHRARGAVVSKDDLVLSCWEGRVVGEDAINRVISRLRKLSEDFGHDEFRIETVTRVGYRLVLRDGAAPADLPPQKTVPAFAQRRSLLIGSGAAIAIAIGGWLTWGSDPPLPPELQKLLDDAETALDYATVEQTATAVGLLQEATRRYPEQAIAWGRLAIAYRRQGVNNPFPSGRNVLERSEAAARRALEIDAGNVDAKVILTVGKGLWYASYADYDARTRKAFARFPEHEIARGARSTFLFETGRIRESAAISVTTVDDAVINPRSTSHARKLWAMGRLDEAEALLRKMIARWPRHPGVWRSLLTFLCYTGRAEENSAALENFESWPDDLESVDIELLRLQVSALASKNAANVAAALKAYDAVASASIGKAEDAAAFASAIGSLDVAFRYLDLLFFSGELAKRIRREFPASDLQTHSGKQTYFLFEPPMRNARADPRFNALTTRLGLNDYWRGAGVSPDYIV
jgi:DNA-binding winged helix-turn-helix (wHTH) protein/tetratricopeptide (TPR) repeat protein